MANTARSRESYQALFEPVVYNGIIGTGDTGTVAALPAKTDHITHVQSILVSCTTGAAQTLTFQDAAGVVLARTKATSVQGEAYLFDFGPQGFPITAANAFNIVISGAGMGAAVHIEGYYKPNAVRAV